MQVSISALRQGSTPAWDLQGKLVLSSGTQGVCPSGHSSAALHLSRGAERCCQPPPWAPWTRALAGQGAGVLQFPSLPLVPDFKFHMQAEQEPCLCHLALARALSQPLLNVNKAEGFSSICLLMRDRLVERNVCSFWFTEK